MIFPKKLSVFMKWTFMVQWYRLSVPPKYRLSISGLGAFGLAFLMIAIVGCKSLDASGKDVASQATYLVSGQVQQLKCYCGGAKPPQTLLDRLAIPVPYPQKTFHVRAGNVNSLKAAVVAHFTTDAEGKFALRLPPGSYAIVQDEQLKVLDPARFADNTHAIDQACLEEWWQKPYSLIEVQATDLPPLNFVFQKRCFIDSDLPCIAYTGPPPH